MSPRPRIALLAASGLMLGACAGEAATESSAATGSGTEVAVVATTTVWADVAGRVTNCAGAGAVPSLSPVGADPHDFSPSSQDIAQLVAADLVIANGLGLEQGLASSLESAQADGARVFEVAPLLDPMPFGDHEGEDHTADEHEEDGHESLDPHVWLDIARVAEAARLIGTELTALTGDPRFEACGQTVQAELTDLDEQVAATLSTVPEPRRILVTDHDALAYLAAAYGYTVAGTVIPGGTTLGEPSSAQVAQLAATVRDAAVPAIFANTANPQALVDALATEVGDVEVVELYVGSVGAPGSAAATYSGMMTTNAQRISDALAD